MRLLSGIVHAIDSLGHPCHRKSVVSGFVVVRFKLCRYVRRDGPSRRARLGNRFGAN
jgi:hypothetical protein